MEEHNRTKITESLATARTLATNALKYYYRHEHMHPWDRDALEAIIMLCEVVREQQERIEKLEGKANDT